MVSKRDFLVRFAGEGGQGMVTSAEGLAQAAAQVGYHVQTFATFPSQILGGPTWTQTRISTTPVLSSGDQLDVLVAFNKEAYDQLPGDLKAIVARACQAAMPRVRESLSTAGPATWRGTVWGNGG